MNNFIQTMILITLSSVPLMVSYLLKRRHKKSMQQLETEDEYYHQSLFINMKNFSCKQHLIDRKECGDYCSYTHLETLLKFISSAKISICLCMYTFTLKQINMELIRAHKNGIKIRIITDRVMAQTDISKFNISKLKEIGIPCKVQQSYQSMMHHKFCVIDKEDRDSAKMFFW
ncbi:hypothetical protein NQ317_016375 [Molorchus minor]|uniref:Mitochondrial cardiolipin hydrolase n=1 Tax=Molorchus minor TaxID=1323400 RepID=A0ABQ9JJX3_9CUCU|nr:hypothetical protein NQ317_016375 [Molorchus minor]